VGGFGLVAGVGSEDVGCLQALAQSVQFAGECDFAHRVEMIAIAEKK